MIVLEHVGLEYVTGQPILKDVSMELPAGSFHLLAGPSGVGKSSLLSILWLQRRVTSGTIHMFGEDITHKPRHELPKLRRRVGIVLQDYRLLDHLTIAQNVGLPLKVAGESKEQVDAKVRELLEWIGLAECHDAKPSTLSGGQKQRAAIARAVITKPDLLLADEPTGNLDRDLAERLLYLFEALNQGGTTILFATHDAHLIEQFKYPTLRLKDGTIEK